MDSEPGAAEFESLVELYYGPLYRFAMSLTRTESDASDLVQDTFATWAEKGGQLQDRSKIKAWLFTTLHRRFLAMHRRQARFPHVEIAEADQELPSVEIDMVERLDANGVLELLGRVDPQFQSALSLFYLEDYAYGEIAEILQVPLGTVKSRIARGLAQLRGLVMARQTMDQKEPS